MIYFYVLLLRIVAYLEGAEKMVSFAVVFGLMTFSTLKRLPTLKINKTPKYIFYATLLVFVLFFHGVVFGNILLRDVAVLFTYWIWTVFTYFLFKNKSIEEVLRFIYISFLIFNITNYVYYELYFSDQKPALNSILGLFGIMDYRVYFPLSSGANVFTSQLGLNAIISLFFIKKANLRYLYLIFLLFYMYLLVLADSRIILLFTILLAFIYWFSLKRVLTFLKKTWWVFGLIIIMTLYIFYSTNIFDSFKRAGEIIGRSTSRLDIWTIAIQIIFDGPKVFFGHGINGFENNLPSSLIGTFESEKLQTSHNFILQNLIDFGLFGLSVILLAIHNILYYVYKIKHAIISVLVVMFLLFGITESIPTFYSMESTIFFIALLSIIITQYETLCKNYLSNNDRLV